MLFTVIFSKANIPKHFKTSCVIPLYKQKGPRYYGRSYRSIACVSYLCKIFEKVLYFRLSKMVEEYLNDNQFGFCKNRGCENAIHKFI